MCPFSIDIAINQIYLLSQCIHIFFWNFFLDPCSPPHQIDFRHFWYGEHFYGVFLVTPPLWGFKMADSLLERFKLTLLDRYEPLWGEVWLFLPKLLQHGPILSHNSIISLLALLKLLSTLPYSHYSFCPHYSSSSPYNVATLQHYLTHITDLTYDTHLSSPLVVFINESINWPSPDNSANTPPGT